MATLVVVACVAVVAGDVATASVASVAALIRVFPGRQGNLLGSATVPAINIIIIKKCSQQPLLLAPLPPLTPLAPLPHPFDERRRAIVIELINTPQNAAGDAKGERSLAGQRWGVESWGGAVAGAGSKQQAFNCLYKAITTTAT